MSLTIADLVADPKLRTKLLAGESGVQRKVNWAHNTEAEEPWYWLSAGELLLTLGRNFPKSAEDQIGFIRSLFNAGLAGLDLAEGWFAPPLTLEAKIFADEIGFPILQTAYEIPFVLVVRSVAEATSRTNQLTKILQMYESYRQTSLKRQSEEEQLVGLSKHLAVELTILDIKNFRVVLPYQHGLTDGLIYQIKQKLNRAPLPAVFRVKDNDINYLVVSMGSDTQALVVKTATIEVDLIELQHTASVVSFIAERYSANIEARTTNGRRLLSQLLENLVDRELAKEQLEQFKLETGPWRVACPQGGLPIDLNYVYIIFAREQIPAIVTLVNGELVVLGPADFKWTEQLLESLVGLEGIVGLSSQINSLSRLADGAREAAWARESTKASQVRICIYCEDEPMFLPRTISAAQLAVDSILGPVIAYDDKNSSDLMKSLETLLKANMSWRQASAELGIHRQTLNYRMQRVAELTNRHVSNLNDLTELHLAIRAKNMFD